jgi:hypothetical protein
MSGLVEIKILRLNTGEDIVGSCLMDDENGCVGVESPMKVSVQRSVELGQTMLVMYPWLPLEIVSDNFATINYADIITIVEPKDSFVEYYNNMVIQYEEIIEEREKQGTFDFRDEGEDEEFDSDMNQLEEILESMKESKTKVFH